MNRWAFVIVRYADSDREAIKTANFSDAKFLGEDARIGSIAPGKQADLMVVKGNPAANISDIEKVEIVFMREGSCISANSVSSLQLSLLSHSESSI